MVQIFLLMVLEDLLHLQLLQQELIYLVILILLDMMDLHIIEEHQLMAL